MLAVPTEPRQRLCDGTTRRDFVQAGFLGTCGLSLVDVLRLGAAQAAQSGTSPGNNPKSVILIWLHGGQTQLETYDMKPSAPAEVRGPYKPINTNLDGLQVCELLPRLAKVMDKVTIHRGFHHTNNDHCAAAH